MRDAAGLGLIEAIPQQCAGLRSDPPTSLPSPSGDIPVASAAASPPLEPPAVTPGPTGCGSGRGARSGVHAQAEVGRLVRPIGIAPGGAQPLDERRVDRGIASASATPWVVGGPARSMFSLTVTARRAGAAARRRVGGVGSGAGLVGEHG